MHSSILRQIWLNFMALCLVLIRRLFLFSLYYFFFRISNFFDLSITEETWVVEMRIWFICFFVFSRTRNFSAVWRLSPLPVTGLQILPYARCSVPLSREGSLSCHTYCDTGPRFIRSHPKDWALTSQSGIRTPDARIIKSLRPTL
jgi:hypothetical protein